jgi:CheY-like chemotaxis protein
MAAAHILCVDDDPDTCASLSDVLADLGYRVRVAYNGETALQLLDEDGYRLQGERIKIHKSLSIKD